MSTPRYDSFLPILSFVSRSASFSKHKGLTPCACACRHRSNARPAMPRVPREGGDSIEGGRRGAWRSPAPHPGRENLGPGIRRDPPQNKTKQNKNTAPHTHEYGFCLKRTRKLNRKTQNKSPRTIYILSRAQMRTVNPRPAPRLRRGHVLPTPQQRQLHHLWRPAAANY